jgi:hypothetical protein
MVGLTHVFHRNSGPSKLEIPAEDAVESHFDPVLQLVRVDSGKNVLMAEASHLNVFDIGEVERDQVIFR